MNEYESPAAAEQENHVAYEGQTQLWDAITLGNWNDVEDILNSSFITLDQKRDLIQYSARVVDRPRYQLDLNLFQYSLRQGAPLSIIKMIVDTAMMMGDQKKTDDDKNDKNDKNGSSLKRILFPKETDMSTVIECASPSVDVIQFVAGIIMSVEGGAEAIINTHRGATIMHDICRNSSVTVELIEAVAQIMMSVEGGAEAMIKSNLSNYDIMNTICRNYSVTAPLFKAVAMVMLNVKGGAEVLFNNNRSPRDSFVSGLIGYNPTDAEIKLEVLLAAASIAKKYYNQDDTRMKLSIRFGIMDFFYDEHLPTPGIIPALKMGMIWEYGLEDIIKRNMDGLIIADETTGLYPFMIAGLSTNPNPDLDTVYKVLMTYPDVLRTICPAHQSKKRRLTEEPDNSKTK